MIPYDHPLAEATRYNDAETEDHGIEHVAANAGLEFSFLYYVAEQRALRAVLAKYGRANEFPHRTDEGTAILLTPDQREEVENLAPFYLDGIMIGWRAAQIESRGGDKN